MTGKLKHGIYALAKSGQFDQEFFLQLCNDYGGLEEISAAKQALCKQAAWRKLLIESAMIYIQKHGIFVPDRRNVKNPKVSPLVNLVNNLMNALRQDLVSLGLDRKKIEKTVPTWDEWVEGQNQLKAKEDSRDATV